MINPLHSRQFIDNHLGKQGGSNRSNGCDDLQQKKPDNVFLIVFPSTDEEEQLNSFANQVRYYREYCQQHPGYVLADIYADEGISGTNVTRRTEFMRMIADCEAGKIDMVITKSVSRFARNTKDCLEYSRKLKTLGIPILFEQQNINTMEGSGELLFTILSSLAQDESRHISENSAWGIRALFRQGVVRINTNRFLGYDKREDGKLIVNPEQAEIVRRIFTEFMDGRDPAAIAKGLRDDGVIGVTGKCCWQVGTVMSILRNEKYMGDALLQKYYTPDFLDHKNVLNEGQLEQYYIKGDHEAIVDETLWKAAQQEIGRREAFRKKHGVRTLGRYTDEQPFTHRVICAECGSVFWRRTWYREYADVKVWQCGKRYKEKGVTGCCSENLLEKDLHRAFVQAWNAILDSRDERLPVWEAQAGGDDPLLAFRARQMTELTSATHHMARVDLRLVAKVLEHVDVCSAGLLGFHFLDGTGIQVQLQGLSY